MVPGSYPFFGPPYTEGERYLFSIGGTGVHDHICNLAEDGSEFSLCLADGGSVHFLWQNDSFVAKEVYDPHGLKTTLRWEDDDHLFVEQDGGRFLKITWGPFSGGGNYIQTVQSGTGLSGTEVNQTVSYHYSDVPGTYSPALQKAGREER